MQILFSIERETCSVMQAGGLGRKRPGPGSAFTCSHSAGFLQLVVSEFREHTSPYWAQISKSNQSENVLSSNSFFYSEIFIGI